MATPIDVVYSNVVKFVRREIGEIVRYLVDKKSAASQTVATGGSRPKSARASPKHMYSRCSRFDPNRLTLGGVIAERVNTVFAL